MDFLSTHPLLKDTKIVVSGKYLLLMLISSCTASRSEVPYASTLLLLIQTW